MYSFENDPQSKLSSLHECEYVCNLIEENKYYVYFECSSGSNCCYSMVQGSNL